MESFSGLLLLKLFIINDSCVNLCPKATLHEKQFNTHTTIKQAIACLPQGVELTLLFGFE
jgi:hypothetical protein